MHITQIPEPQRPILRVPTKKLRDIILCIIQMILTNFIGNQLAMLPNGTQQTH